MRTAAPRHQDLETRERLLHAAERLFADRGFAHVTVREICQAAHANVAAVNYHFGDKLGLYKDIVQAAIDRMRATNDAARRAGAGRAPEEQLRSYIVIFSRRLLAAGGDTLHRVIAREMHDPTPALDAVVEQGIRPRLEYVAGLVAAMIGCAPADARVLRSVASIQSQSIAYLPNAIAERVGLPSRLSAAEIDAIAQHIAEFSIAGIHAIAAADKAARAARA